MGEQIDAVVEAWRRAIVLCTEAIPGAFERLGPRGTAEIVTGLPVATLNGLIQIAPVVDVDEVTAFATSPRLAELPWGLQVRDADAADRVAAVAAEHKLVQRSPLPLMVKELTDADATAVEPTVRRISGADSDLYRRALAAGFEGPEFVFEGFSAPALLDHPAMAPYVVEVAGAVVATSFGVRVDDTIGVFNISVPPEHRRRGYGRVATAAVLTDAYREGARTAYLNASVMGEPLYLAMGFRTAETWTVFTA
ncbi:Acetyltransferase (GNAT) family protein [Asanoa hainanensis]|uniref:Acetyltransferase (GNAT) family protein n=1 Tax=Asanoa hainanensis TaxID=560556 RepID=A0A239I316_9ACTN|nr:GNAT family N-acetyltransferase [Asanoa hainanensis]SNS87977.1 Acetyltransferase (GNAT) family protein [Asanoa hainanensis]